jgi:hypothetical protein
MANKKTITSKTQAAAENVKISGRNWRRIKNNMSPIRGRNQTGKQCID